MKRLTEEQKRLALFVGLVVIVAGILLVGIVTFIQNASKNPYGNALSIGKYDQTVAFLPKEYKDSFDAMLYKIVALNSGEQTAKNVRDATIRDGSHVKKTSTDTRHAGSFIVDIASIKQSYVVQYEYTSDPSDNFTSGYPLLISCPDQSQLRYGDFNCKDIYSSTFQEVDPVISKLPYEALDYRIEAVTNIDNRTSLLVTVYIAQAEQSNQQSKIDQVRSSVTEWLQANVPNWSDYLVNYQTQVL